ncbi:unnamed protein product [Prunus brigantina]
MNIRAKLASDKYPLRVKHLISIVCKGCSCDAINLPSLSPVRSLRHNFPLITISNSHVVTKTLNSKIHAPSRPLSQNKTTQFKFQQTKLKPQKYSNQAHNSAQWKPQKIRNIQILKEKNRVFRVT